MTDMSVLKARPRQGLEHRSGSPVWMLICGFIVFAMSFGAMPGAAPAAAKAGEVAPKQSCDLAARHASVATGVPITVLRAITRTETGRHRDGHSQPWPWTVNMEGKGHWFSTRAEARIFAQAAFDRGAQSFDVGCFQINYRWHHAGFASIDSMFDPRQNALYAAQFLNRLYRETGDWSLAAGAYHSRTPAYAKRYIARYEQELKALPPEQKTPRQTRSRAVTTKSRPLFANGNGGGRLGSLVPARQSRDRAFVTKSNVTGARSSR